MLFSFPVFFYFVTCSLIKSSSELIKLALCFVSLWSSLRKDITKNAFFCSFKGTDLFPIKIANNSMDNQV